MAIKINMRRVAAVTIWGIVGAGVLVLLVAAIRYRNSNTCKGFRIEIAGPSAGLFIDKKGIADLLTGYYGQGKGLNKPIQSFDLHRLETALEKNVWIRDAQLFFDNNGILRVNVIERIPAARIFTRDGNSFYVDSTGVQLPLQDKIPARLPVFTGYPASKIRLQGKDSLLTVGILRISDLIRKDTFWSAQVAQVDITDDRLFELEPEVGHHRVTFGDGNELEQKFHRLFLFYKEVLSRTGFDKYDRIDVSFAGQVIGTKKGSEQSRYDSLQGMNNIRQLIHSAQQLQPDTIRQQNIRPLEQNTMSEQTLTNYDLVPATNDSVSSGTITVNAHPPPHEKPAARRAARPKPPASDAHQVTPKPKGRSPRAIMPGKP
jgi:cell division protein FtsQ